MFRRIVLPILAAALAALSLSSPALAQEGGGWDLIKARGEVIAVDPAAGSFQIENSDGTTMEFHVSEATAFRGLGGLQDLQVGWRAGVAAREDENGRLWAVLVLAGDAAGLAQARGRITDVNTAAGKFSLQTPAGEELRFFVDEDTRYGGQIHSLEDLEIGMGAGVVYQEHSEGKLIAVGLVAGSAPALAKARGEVTAVDAEMGTFQILTADGIRMSFSVDEATRYQGQLSSLEEMEVGWQAGVASKQEEDGSLTAVLVIAGVRPEVVRAQGVIAAVDPGAGKFQLEKPDGEILDFSVDGSTNYRGEAESFSDLQQGQRAAVGGYEDSQGILVARNVLTGSLPGERPEIVRGQGTVKTVSPGAGKFQLEKSDGSVLTIYVDGNTSYRGQVGGFEDLEKGLRAGFVGVVDGDGKIIARMIVAGVPRSERPGGERPAPEAEPRPPERSSIPTT